MSHEAYLSKTAISLTLFLFRLSPGPRERLEFLVRKLDSGRSPS